MSSAFALIVHSQEQKHIPMQDSPVNKTQTFNAGSLYPYPALSLPLSSKTSPEGFPVFLHLSLASLLPSLSWESRQNLSLASCWRNELLRQEKHKTLRTILGSIEMGGAAYLTYVHIKKYGLK